VYNKNTNNIRYCKDLITEFSIMQSKGVGKFCSKQFGCNKQLDLLAVDLLNGFYCIWRY